MARHLVLARAVLTGLTLIMLWGLLLGTRQLINVSGLGVYVKMAGNFLFMPEGLVEEHEGRINILLLGKAGKDPVLTDTMIMVSMRRGQGSNAVMLSIPRDIWVPEFSDKINSAYSRGGDKGGLILAKSVVEEVVGVPINYALTFNFEGFVEIVNILGGVEVEVERSFTDNRFPIPGREDDDCGGDPEFLCRYESVSFEKGRQLMDGATALKLTRSRHSEDPGEGTDLARAARQHKVILAIKEKALKPETFLSPEKVSRLWSAFWVNVETDLSGNQLAYIARIVFDVRDSILSYAIPEELLFNPPYSPDYNNLYVFIPKDGDWGRIHEWVLGIL